MAQHEIVMAGTGGQGLIFVASFLAEAAMNAGMNVTQTQTYGIAQRGGFISAEVLIDKDEILFQQVSEPSIVLALSDVVGTRYDDVKVPVIYDTSIMNERYMPNWHGLPCTNIAHEIGVPRAANLVGLGAAMSLYQAVKLEDLYAMARSSFGKLAIEQNIKAIRLGAEAAESFRERS